MANTRTEQIINLILLGLKSDTLEPAQQKALKEVLTQYSEGLNKMTTAIYNDQKMVKDLSAKVTMVIGNGTIDKNTAQLTESTINKIIEAALHKNALNKELLLEATKGRKNDQGPGNNKFGGPG